MKQTIEELRNSIEYPRNQFEEINQWRFYEEANCYQFAIMTRFYLPLLKRLMPGEIAGYEIQDDAKYTDEGLLFFVKEDLKALGLTAEFCDVGAELLEGQWKIAIMNCSIDSRKGEYDFHFLRQTTATYHGYWLHKLPDEQHPDMRDSRERIITNPADGTNSFGYKYHYVKTLKISKKK